MFMIMMSMTTIFNKFCGSAKNLKELSLSNHKEHVNLSFFPTRDIRSECGFKLKKLIYYSTYCGFDDNFLKFLSCQIEYLTELKLWGKYSPEILDVIFKYGKKLNKLTLYPNTPFSDVSIYCLTDVPSAKLFSFNTSQVKFYQILKRVPNVVSLRFTILDDITATLPQLESLHIVYLYCDKLLNLKMPNLKKLTVNHLDEKNILRFLLLIKV